VIDHAVAYCNKDGIKLRVTAGHATLHFAMPDVNCGNPLLLWPFPSIPRTDSVHVRIVIVVANGSEPFEGLCALDLLKDRWREVIHHGGSAIARLGVLFRRRVRRIRPRSALQPFANPLQHGVAHGEPVILGAQSKV